MLDLSEGEAAADFLLATTEDILRERILDVERMERVESMLVRMFTTN